MSKEDELAKELVEVVPNTYGDLHDAPVEYIEILSSGKVGETKTIPQDTVITSLAFTGTVSGRLDFRR